MDSMVLTTFHFSFLIEFFGLKTEEKPVTFWECDSFQCYKDASYSYFSATVWGDPPPPKISNDEMVLNYALFILEIRLVIGILWTYGWRSICFVTNRITSVGNLIKNWAKRPVPVRKTAKSLRNTIFSDFLTRPNVVQSIKQPARSKIIKVLDVTTTESLFDSGDVLNLAVDLSHGRKANLPCMVLNSARSYFTSFRGSKSQRLISVTARLAKSLDLTGSSHLVLSPSGTGSNSCRSVTSRSNVRSLRPDMNSPLQDIDSPRSILDSVRSYFNSPRFCLGPDRCVVISLRTVRGTARLVLSSSRPGSSAHNSVLGTDNAVAASPRLVEGSDRPPMSFLDSERSALDSDRSYLSSDCSVLPFTGTAIDSPRLSQSSDDSVQISHLSSVGTGGTVIESLRLVDGSDEPLGSILGSVHSVLGTDDTLSGSPRSVEDTDESLGLSLCSDRSILDSDYTTFNSSRACESSDESDMSLDMKLPPLVLNSDRSVLGPDRSVLNSNGTTIDYPQSFVKSDISISNPPAKVFDFARSVVSSHDTVLHSKDVNCNSSRLFKSSAVSVMDSTSLVLGLDGSDFDTDHLVSTSPRSALQVDHAVCNSAGSKFLSANLLPRSDLSFPQNLDSESLAFSSSHPALYSSSILDFHKSVVDLNSSVLDSTRSVIGSAGLNLNPGNSVFSSPRLSLDSPRPFISSARSVVGLSSCQNSARSNTTAISHYSNMVEYPIELPPNYFHRPIPNFSLPVKGLVGGPSAPENLDSARSLDSLRYPLDETLPSLSSVEISPFPSDVEENEDVSELIKHALNKGKQKSENDNQKVMPSVVVQEPKRNNVEKDAISFNKEIYFLNDTPVSREEYIKSLQDELRSDLYKYSMYQIPQITRSISIPEPSICLSPENCTTTIPDSRKSPRKTSRNSRLPMPSARASPKMEEAVTLLDSSPRTIINVRAAIEALSLEELIVKRPPSRIPRQSKTCKSSTVTKRKTQVSDDLATPSNIPCQSSISSANLRKAKKVTFAKTCKSPTVANKRKTQDLTSSPTRKNAQKGGSCRPGPSYYKKEFQNSAQSSGTPDFFLSRLAMKIFSTDHSPRCQTKERKDKTKEDNGENESDNQGGDKPCCSNTKQRSRLFKLKNYHSGVIRQGSFDIYCRLQHPELPAISEDEAFSDAYAFTLSDINFFETGEILDNDMLTRPDPEYDEWIADAMDEIKDKTKR